MVSVMIFLGGCRTEEPINGSPSDTAGTTQTDSKRTEITSGYDLESSKPMPSQRIALKCYSFYPTGEKVTVKASMGDNYTYSEEHNTAPSYSTYGENGYPVFEVYPSDRMSNKDLDSSNVQINKNGKEYRKEFEKDDLAKLDNSNFKDDVSKYHYEEVELDLSNCAVGESGTIKFAFGWQYETEPSHFSGGLWEGQRKQLGYYVADDGVYINFNGAESAQEDAKNDKGASEIEHFERFEEGIQY